MWFYFILLFWARAIKRKRADLWSLGPYKGSRIRLKAHNLESWPKSLNKPSPLPWKVDIRDKTCKTRANNGLGSHDTLKGPMG